MPRLPLLLLCAILPLVAQAGEAPVTLALFHPVSTNQAPIRTNLALSFLYGDVGAVKGVGLGLFASRVRGPAYGIHGAGMWSRIDGDFGGALFVPGMSWVRGNAYGGQLAIGALVNEGNARGAFVSLAVNSVGGDFAGFQFTGAANIVDGDATGVMLSAFGNIAGKDFRGIAFSSGYNYAGARMLGVQLGGVNFAGRARGAQLGIANFARDSKALQVGIVNSADHQGGVPLGLVNLAGNGVVEGVAYASNLAPVHVGVRTEVHHVSSMVTLGGIDRVGDVETTAILTWNLGFGVPLVHGTELIVDAGLAHYMPQHTSEPNDNDRLHPATQARALLRANLGPRIRLIAGGGISRIFDAYEDGAGFVDKPLWLAGVGWQ